MANLVDIRTLAKKRGVPFIDLSREAPDPRCMRLLKEDSARQYRSIPVRFLGDGVLVAFGDPEQKDALDRICALIGRKVYPALADGGAIDAAIERFYTNGTKGREHGDAASGAAGRIVSVISNKGGVGKTHIAVNMAKVIASSGKSVLLIDADLGNADISNKLALFPEYTLYDFMLGDVDLENMIEKTPYGFDLIASSSGEFKLANINYIQRTKFIRGFRKISSRYDFAIFDLSAGISSVVMEFALASDDIVVVSTPQDIIAGYACIKAAFQHFKDIEEKLVAKVEFYRPVKVFSPWVVMNQISDLNQGIFIFNRICQTADERINSVETFFSVKPQYLGGVVYDKEVVRGAESQRRPITLASPKSRPSQCLEYLGRTIMEPPELRMYSQEVKGGLGRFAMIFGMG
jgi:flagellar biosynthesis protein FlhG